jgi:hypothetical protein
MNSPLDPISTQLLPPKIPQTLGLRLCGIIKVTSINLGGLLHIVPEKQLHLSQTGTFFSGLMPQGVVAGAR